MAMASSWVLLQRDTPSGVAAFADDVLAASRAVLRGVEPAQVGKTSQRNLGSVPAAELKSTVSTPRDTHGRRKPRRRPLTDAEKAQREEWRAIQTEHQEHQNEQRLRAAAKIAWGEQFRKQLASQGSQAGQRAASRQLENDVDYIRATGLSEQKRKKSAAARKARRQHDIAALDAWRQRQTGAASAAVGRAQEERAKSEQQWQAIQAKKADLQRQREDQNEIVRHRSKLGALLRAVDDAAASTADGDTPLPQPGGRVESAAWQLSPNAQAERWNSVRAKVKVEARKAHTQRMREKYKENAARNEGEDAPVKAGSEWRRWPACSDRARSSAQTG